LGLSCHSWVSSGLNDLGVAGAPDLLTVEVLRRTLDIQAVLGVEIDVPAHRAGVVLGVTSELLPRR
jgi:hypothetical protein